MSEKDVCPDKETADTAQNAGAGDTGSTGGKAKRKPARLSRSFQRRLLICVIVAFLATTAFLWVTQTRLSENNAIELLQLNISDVRHDIMDASDENLLSLTHTIADRLNTMGQADSATLAELASEYGVAEISCVDKSGIIAASTTSAFIGYDMAVGEQASAFLVLLNGETEYVQAYQPISYGDGISMKYAGVSLADGGFVQVGYDAVRFQQDIDGQVVGVTRNRHVGENGFILICNENWDIVSDAHGNEGKNLDVTGIWIDRPSMPEGESFEATVYGAPSYCMYVVTEGYYIVAVLPQSEAVLSRNAAVGITTVMEVVVFLALFALIYYLIRRFIVDDIRRVNGSLARITGGDLDVTVDVRGSEEFVELSDGINATVGTLKRYISEAEARIDRELEYARTIQHSALPSVFPPYPGRHDFDIYASMYTAKEVGGDFYDFYLLDENTLAILIADVSGKGIPAAMFMMTAKTMLKSCAEAGMEVNEVFTRANEKLCEGNEADMFVTAWMAFVDLTTGHVRFCNAGHNPPLLETGGSWDWLKGRSGLVLATMEGINYRMLEFDLMPGDTIFLYTDGVTEATDSNDELYSDPRLLETLQGLKPDDMKSLCDAVKDDVDTFVGEAPQFDDITMLAFRYLGGEAK